MSWLPKVVMLAAVAMQIPGLLQGSLIATGAFGFCLGLLVAQIILRVVRP